MLTTAPLIVLITAPSTIITVLGDMLTQRPSLKKQLSGPTDTLATAPATVIRVLSDTLTTALATLITAP